VLGLSKAASSSSVLPDTSNAVLPTTGKSGSGKDSSPDRKMERRGREGARSSPVRTLDAVAAKTAAPDRKATDSPDSRITEEATGRRSSAVESGVLKSLENIGVRKQSELSRKHSDSGSARVSSAETSARPFESRPAHSANLGRPEGKSFALPDRPADLTTGVKTADTRKQRRSSGSGGSSSAGGAPTPPRISSSETGASSAVTSTATGRQAQTDGGHPTRPENGETVIGWKPIQALHGAGDRNSPAERLGGVLTVEEEVR
jgi:hypothetical protein